MKPRHLATDQFQDRLQSNSRVCFLVLHSALNEPFRLCPAIGRICNVYMCYVISGHSRYTYRLLTVKLRVNMTLAWRTYRERRQIFFNAKHVPPNIRGGNQHIWITRSCPSSDDFGSFIYLQTLLYSSLPLLKASRVSQLENHFHRWYCRRNSYINKTENKSYHNPRKYVG